jgi:hypothetical protein
MIPHTRELAEKVAPLVWEANKESYSSLGLVHYEIVLRPVTGAWGMELMDEHDSDLRYSTVWLTNQIQLYIDVRKAPEKYVGLLGDSDKYVALLVAKAFKGEL